MLKKKKIKRKKSQKRFIFGFPSPKHDTRHCLPPPLT